MKTLKHILFFVYNLFNMLVQQRETARTNYKLNNFDIKYVSMGITKRKLPSLKLNALTGKPKQHWWEHLS